MSNILDDMRKTLIYNNNVLLESLSDRFENNIITEITKDYIIDSILSNDKFTVNNDVIDIHTMLHGNYSDLVFRLRLHDVQEFGDLMVTISDVIIILTELKYIEIASMSVENFCYNITNKAKKLPSNYFVDKYHERQKIEADKKIAEETLNLNKTTIKSQKIFNISIIYIGALTLLYNMFKDFGILNSTIVGYVILGLFVLIFVLLQYYKPKKDKYIQKRDMTSDKDFIQWK